ncbi:MAG: substrate-binding domain-containing protein [Oligosphaeraceae bacterium]|nr:substrate-binding domain-containing protein [Oligosphaeraceae bacterium]
MRQNIFSALLRLNYVWLNDKRCFIYPPKTVFTRKVSEKHLALALLIVITTTVRNSFFEEIFVFHCIKNYSTLDKIIAGTTVYKLIKLFIFMKKKSLSMAAKIAEELLKAIREGKYTSKKSLPSLRQLACRHNTSVSTARAALQILIHKNEVVGYHGRGYFVRAESAPQQRKIILILSRPGEMYDAMLEELLHYKTKHPEIYIVIETIDQNPERLQASIEHMISNGLDTIIINAVSINHLGFITQYADQVKLYGFFHIASSITHPCFLPGVYSDWYHGGYIGVRHLIDCGCQNILVLLSTQGAIQSDCRAGATRAAMDAIHPIKIEFCYDYDLESEQQFNMESLSEYLNNGVTGIFCFKHAIAFRVYDFLKTNHYRIPQDVKVIEYYDSSLSLNFSPPLTSISVCPKEISKELLKMYHSGQKQVITVRPSLIKRASTV